MSRELNEQSLINEKLLHALLVCVQPQTVQALAQHLGLSPKDVIAEIERLEKVGCRFDRHPQEGIRLVESSMPCWKDYLQFRCHGVTDRVIEVYRKTSSTQDRARQIVAAKGAAADGAVVVSNEQSAGRGRLGRQWVAPPGTGILLTRVCTEQRDGQPLTIDRLTLAAAVAVAKAVENVSRGQVDVKIKWPNDILVGRKKLAGILVETFNANGVRAAIVGVGLNVSIGAEQVPDELKEILTSLAMNGCFADRLSVLTELVWQLDLQLNTADLPGLVAAWRERSNQLSHAIDVRCDGIDYRGFVVDLDPLQGLIFRTNAGTLLHLPAETTTILP